MKTNLFIPSKIRVGFRKRSDTFTGMLAYVIYYDEKGKIRKEKSWTGWCDDSITTLEIDNDPRNGYIFNKGVKRDGHWGSGRSVIRVYDPRDFEFEISVDNLIGLLMHSDVSKRDIVEDCVFAWSGADLVLLPTNSVEYTESVEYTAKQSLKVSARDLVVGRQYGQKKHSGILTYIGRFPWLTSEYKYGYSSDIDQQRYQKDKGKKHIFVNSAGTFFPTPATTLSHEISTSEVSNVADLIDKYFHTSNSQRIKSFVVRSAATQDVSNRSYVELHKIEDDRIIKAYLYAYGQNTTNLERQPISISFDDIKTDEDGHLIRVLFNSARTNYNYYNRISDKRRLLETYQQNVTQQLRTMLRDADIDVTKATRENIFAGLIEMGYGDLHIVLENGNTIPNKT